MKFTLSWLKDHLQTDAALADIVEAMTMAGLEVEHVDDPAQKYKQFTAARILSASPHPNADKLQVCQVETRDGVLEIVCGAMNARAGLMTAFAPIGAYIPGGDFTLVPKPVRGVVSNGMLCSESELEIDDDVFGLRKGRFGAWKARADALGKSESEAIADGGIMELPDDVKVGAPIAAVIGASDPVIDFEATPNRPDWLGVAGIARDLAAKGVGKLVTPAVKPVVGKFAPSARIAIDDESACPMFVGRVIRGVTNRPSPPWLQARLRAIGLRPRNGLVDVTNYLCFDRARPLHVYDLAKLSGAVRVRLGAEGDVLDGLDGQRYAMTAAMCVIADEARIINLGGIMGDAHTGVSEDTTDILLESALFDRARVFAAGRATGIVSDAHYRNARGIDPQSCVDGAELATRMILDVCGGEASTLAIIGAAPSARAPLSFDPDRVRTLAGLDIKPVRVRAILKSLGFANEPEDQSGKRLRVQIPSWRGDVEGPADLVEEVARIEGFDKLPAVAPPRAAGFRRPPASVRESRTRIARRAAAALGFQEAVTWSFCARRHAEAFGGGGESLLIANPIAAELDCMRPSALPNLIVAAQKNADRGYDDARLFEAGPAFLDDGERGQIRTLAALLRARPKRHWANAPAPDIFDIKRDCMTVLGALGAPVASLQTSAETPPWWRPGRAGAVKLGAATLAVFGEIHPRVLRILDVEGPALAFEIFIDAIAAPRAKAGRAKAPLEMSAFMPLTRDFAFILDEATPAASLVRAAYGADKALIADVNLFDVYRGAGVGEGKKSLAIEVTLAPREATLADTDIEAVCAKIVAAVAKATGAALRA